MSKFSCAMFYMLVLLPVFTAQQDDVGDVEEGYEGISNGDCEVGGPGVPINYRRFANTTCVINAKRDTVWEVLVDMGRWSEWNGVFTAYGWNKESPPPVNSSNSEDWFAIASYFETAPIGFKNSNVTMQLSGFDEDEYKICWNPKHIPFLQGRHCYVLCPAGEATLVYNYEDHTGASTDLVHNLMSKAATDGFNSFNDALTAESERASL